MQNELTCQTLIDKRGKWYNSYIFPLVPIFTKREANEYNTVHYGFEWIGIRLWTLDVFEFEVAAVFDPHWGIGFKGILPYLRWVIAIPMPYKMQYWVQRNLWRHPKKNEFQA